MFKSLPKHMLCIHQKNVLDETVLFSTKIMLKLMDGPYFCRMDILYLNYKRASMGPPAKCH